MTEVLDLCVTLTALPPDAPAGTIATIGLRCDVLGTSYSGDLLVDPLTAAEREDLRWYLEEYWQYPFDGFAERGRRVEALLVEVGRRLYGAVFGSARAMAVVQPWRLQQGMQRQVTIASEVPGALGLPWELLHDEQGFLALRAQPVSILRRLPQGEAAGLLTPFMPPLRILLVTARPEGTGFVDPRGIARELLDEVEGQVEQGTIAIEFLRPPTLPALRQRLRDTARPVHVLHFDGHGVFEGDLAGGGSEPGDAGEAGRGLLAFENEAGGQERVSAGDLAQVLQG
ncbi:MAG: CHAT domain-containing protein, partial [Chloroflexota bacterium]|nr:CHAT domain-containing protein [Chloroflexota bacterium]